ncbi:ABC transporter substrate-binding protein [Methylobacterium oryzihabitans]|nr:ABC transporter substrate-binding protein [Methylobacterium oryzihabitans]
MTPRSKLSRRGLLGGAAAAAAVMPRPSLGQSAKAVRITLPWLANGSTLFTYVARNQGFFRKRGIEATIARGYGSVAAAQAVAAGEFDFGFVFAGGTILGAARGLPLVALATLGYDATMGVALRGDSPIRSPQDLAGKTIGTVPTSAEAPYWNAFVKKAGIDVSGTKMVQMDNRVLEQGLVHRQVDAITAIATSSVPVILAMKEPCRFLLWSKSDVSLYAGQVVTRRETLARDPELCRAVTEALTEGLAFALKDPNAALDIFVREVPEIGITPTGRENARVSQGLMHYTVLSPEAETRALGYTDLDRAGAMVDMVMTYGVPKDAVRPDPAQLFSNAFVGSVTLSKAEWDAVRAGTADYAAILG